MSWTRITETGSGRIALRASIDGWPIEFVSEQAMEKTTSDGRERVAGLDIARSELALEESVDPADGIVEGDDIVLTIVDRQVDDRITDGLVKRPSFRSYLLGDLNSFTQDMKLMRTDGLTGVSVVHVGTEAIQVGTIVSASSVTGCARSYWDTLQQGHFTADGEDLAYVEVTDRPVSLEGRRVRLYAYGDGDDLQGDGTLIWRGVALLDARTDLTSWSITVAHISRVLDQELGTALDVPTGSRGIYIPWSAAIEINIAEFNSADAFGGTSGYLNEHDTIWKAGFFEDIGALADSITADISIGTWNADSIVCVPDGDQLQFQVRTGTTAKFVDVSYSGPTEGSGRSGTIGLRSIIDGSLVTEVDADTTYTVPVSEGPIGPPPRGWTGFPEGWRERGTGLLDAGLGSLLTSAPPERIYVDDVAVLDALSAGTDTASIEGDPYKIRSISTSSGYIELVILGSPDFGYHASSPMQIDFTATYVDEGDFGDFIQQLTLLGPTYANKGLYPLVSSEDIDTSAGGAVARVKDATRGRDWATKRTYTASESATLADMFRPELHMLGLYMVTGSDGKLTVKQLVPPTSTAPGATSIGETEVLIDDGPPNWERNAFGSVNTVIVKTGYDPIENEHTGDTHKVRDVTSFSRNRQARVLEIAPLSAHLFGTRLRGAGERVASHGSAYGVPWQDAVELARPILGLLGHEYYRIRVEVPFSRWDVRLGDVVLFSDQNIPNTVTGRRGVSNLAGLVVGRRFELDRGRGSLTLIVPGSDYAGYTPSVFVDSEVNDAGNQWTLTVSKTNGTSRLMADSDDFSDHFGVGYAVKVAQWESSSSTSVNGTVDAVDDAAGTIQVTFDGTWTPSTVDWVLSYSGSSDSDTTSGQQAYCYAASGLDGEIDFPIESVDARVYG